MPRKVSRPLTGPLLSSTRLVGDTCERCKSTVVRCLWDGVGGYLCQHCGAFWSDNAPETEDDSSRVERVNRLFYEKLREQEPDHPWLTTERAKKALGES